MNFKPGDKVYILNPSTCRITEDYIQKIVTEEYRDGRVLKWYELESMEKVPSDSCFATRKELVEEILKLEQ